MAVRLRLTYRDLEALPEEEGKRYELYDGEVYMSASPRVPHQQLAGNLYAFLTAFAAARNLGAVLWSVDVYFTEDTVLAPDIVFVRAGREAIIEEKFVRGAPDLVIEITSPTTELRDRGIKMQAYARHGVPEYWLFNATARTADVYLLRNAVYEPIAHYGHNDVLRSEVLAGLEIPLSSVWPRPTGKRSGTRSDPGQGLNSDA